MSWYGTSYFLWTLSKILWVSHIVRYAWWEGRFWRLLYTWMNFLFNTFFYMSPLSTNGTIFQKHLYYFFFVTFTLLFRILLTISFFLLLSVLSFPPSITVYIYFANTLFLVSAFLHITLYNHRVCKCMSA